MSALLPSDDLVPCPMCASRRIDAAGVQVMCENCGVGTSVEKTLAEAIAAWNRRAAPVGELTADCTKALPDGAIDDTTFEQIEDALDRAEAPCTDSKTGKWLTLPERVAALAPSLPLQEDVARVIERLQGYADDPMWAEHAEVPKSLLRAAILALMGQTGDGGEHA